MRLDHQILLKSPPLDLLAGSAPARYQLVKSVAWNENKIFSLGFGFLVDDVIIGCVLHCQ